MSAATPLHPVLAALADPPPEARIGVAIEGGGMRGAVSGGMALALQRSGLLAQVEAVYGASAGALNGMWLVAGRVEEGAATWWDPALVHALIEPRRLLRGGRVVDVEALVEERYERLSPGVFRAVLDSRHALHPLATAVDTGEAVDLHGLVSDEATLRLALRASSGLPVLAGPPVELGGRRYVDAGVAAAIPFRAALADGITHLLVLRSRRQGEVATPPGRAAGALTRLAVSRVSPQVAATLADRARREGADEAELARHDADPQRRPHVLQVRPDPGAPVPSRLERDVGLVREALEAGRDAAARALAPAAPQRPPAA